MQSKPTLEESGTRPFSFYPPLIGVEHNEWTFSKATWSEVLVHNTKSGQEIWIPRRFIGEMSRVEEPVMIVGLQRELEYRGGTVWPHERRVVSMPKPAIETVEPKTASAEPRAPEPRSPSPVGRGAGAESRVGRMLAIAVAIGVLACCLVVLMMRRSNERVEYAPVMQSDLGFTQADDYYSVVNRLGTPAEDRWRSEQGELQYRLLGYPQRGLYVVLMGPDRKDVHYIGSLDSNWRVVHSVDANTGAMLRRLKKF